MIIYFNIYNLVNVKYLLLKNKNYFQDVFYLLSRKNKPHGILQHADYIEFHNNTFGIIKYKFVTVLINKKIFM